MRDGNILETMMTGGHLPFHGPRKNEILDYPSASTSKMGFFIEGTGVTIDFSDPGEIRVDIANEWNDVSTQEYQKYPDYHIR